MATTELNADAVTLILNGSIINDFVVGDIIVVEYLNPLSSHTKGQNGTTVQQRADRFVGTVTVNVQKNSQSDVILQKIINSKNLQLISGTCKENYRQAGSGAIESYSLKDGSITTQPSNTKNNQEPNATMTYVVQFDEILRLT